MRILVLNQDWFVEEWREAGHEVVTVGMANHLDHVFQQPFIHVDSIQKQIGDFIPDRIVVYDNSCPLMFSGLDETDIPILFYSIDTHHHLVLHQYLYEVFDEMFVAQKDYLRNFEEDGQHPLWLPLWAPRFVELSKEKQHGVAFVGSLNPDLNPERVAFFEQLEKRVPVLCTTGTYWTVFPFAKMVMNQTVRHDLNFRIFESMMCGALLLTERTGNGLFDLFRAGEHLVVYEHGNVDEAVESIRYYLDHECEATRIAEQGRNEILSHHRSHHRAQAVMDCLVALEKKRSIQRFAGCMVNFAVLGNRMARTNPSYSGQAYLQSLRCMENVLLHREVLTESTACFLVAASVGYDRITHTGLGQALLLRASEAYPEVLVLKYAKLRSYLNDGLISEAESLALELAKENPAETFDRAENFVTSLLADEGA